MKPTKIVEHRQQSIPARCERWVATNEEYLGHRGWITHCDAPLRLVITRNPIGALPYDELVVQRCRAGHLAISDGVLRDEPSNAPPIDDGPQDCWGAF